MVDGCSLFSPWEWSNDEVSISSSSNSSSSSNASGNNDAMLNLPSLVAGVQRFILFIYIF